MGDQNAATSAKQLAPSDMIDVEDYESEYIADFELADAPPEPRPEFDISGFQEEEYSRGRMAFLFGQYQMAYEIWKPLAEHGYAKAQATLGWMYHIGKGVNKDLASAYNWYEKAAKQNHPVAQNNLGVFYEQGLYVGKSSRKAARWYREAAEWGYPYAQYNLGTLYLEGRGVKKDEKEAQFWLQIAALQGVEQAILALQKMSVAFHSPKSGDKASTSISQGPQWSKNDTKSTKTKSPHNTPHGSSGYKDIYNRIKSSGHTSIQGFEYSDPASSVNVPSTAESSTPKVPPSTASAPTQNKTADNSVAKSQAKSKVKATTPTVMDETLVKPASDELLPGEKFDRWLAEAQVAQRRLKELEQEKRTNSHSLKIYIDEWVKEQNPKNFTLQLARSDKLDWLLDIAKKQPMLKDTAYYTSTIDGKTWYYLIYGNFDDQQSASAEIDKLPKALKKWSPWVRRFSDVQSKIQTE
ncbi:SPOR domain-containing protein [Kaarinaea lacus]